APADGGAEPRADAGYEILHDPDSLELGAFDAETFAPPYELPPGSLRPPSAPPVWQSDGEHTGRLVVPDAEPLEQTLVLTDAQMRGEAPVTPPGPEADAEETTMVLPHD